MRWALVALALLGACASAQKPKQPPSENSPPQPLVSPSPSPLTVKEQRERDEAIRRAQKKIDEFDINQPSPAAR